MMTKQGQKGLKSPETWLASWNPLEFIWIGRINVTTAISHWFQKTT